MVELYDKIIQWHKKIKLLWRAYEKNVVKHNSIAFLYSLFVDRVIGNSQKAAGVLLRYGQEIQMAGSTSRS